MTCGALGTAFSQASGDGSITGVVTSAFTHQPLPGVMISIFYIPGPGEVTTVPPARKSASITTEPDGRYVFRSLPPGSAVIMPLKPGFASMNIRVRLVAGENAKHDIELAPENTISGTLTDRETGKPIQGVEILADNADSPALSPNRDGWRVRENGNFRGGGLTPGRYTLHAVPWAHEYDPKEKELAEGYGAAWYPGVPRADMAVPIVLSPVEERKIEWRMEKQPFHKLLVDIASESETELHLYANDRLTLHGFVQADEPLRLRNLAAGSYRMLLRSTADNADEILFAEAAFDISNRDPDDLRITMLPAATVRVTLVPDKPDAAMPDTVRFSMFPARPDPRFSVIAVPADKLNFHGVPPGTYRAALSGLPNGMAVAALEINNIPADLYAPVAIAGFTAVRYRITTKPAMIAGTLEGAGGTVRLLPEPAPPNEQGLRTAATGSDGTFAFRNLAPGRYSVSGGGKTEVVQVEENETKQVTLRP